MRIEEYEEEKSLAHAEWDPRVPWDSKLRVAYFKSVIDLNYLVSDFSSSNKSLCTNVHSSQALEQLEIVTSLVPRLILI